MLGWRALRSFPVVAGLAHTASVKVGALQWRFEEAAAKLYEPVLGALLADMRGQIVALCRGVGARRVLDVCCGPAGLTRRVADAGMEVCGVDLSWPMLRQARRHCASQGAADALPVTPAMGSVPLFVRADATSLPFATTHATAALDPSAVLTGPFDVAVLVLALHTMPPAVGRAAVAEMLRVAPYCIVADYRLAERNCDFPAVALGRAVEWLVGGEHYACYKTFMAAGGLEGFAHSQGYAPVARRRILGGAGSIIVLTHLSGQFSAKLP